MGCFGTIRRFVALLLALLLPLPAVSLWGQASYPPVSSSFDLLIVNRRFVSHIVFENTDGQNYLTLILTHGPAYHAFHATPHPLHFPCSSPGHCYREAKKLDQHLRSGWNIGLSLSGSTIQEIVYLKP